MDPWSNTATDTGNYPYLSFFLSIYLSFSVTLSISFSFSHYLIIQQDSIFCRFLSIHENRNEKSNKKKRKKKARPRIQQVQVAEITRVTYGPLERFTKLSGLFLFLSPLLVYFLSFLTVRGRPIRRTRRTYARVFLFLF